MADNFVSVDALICLVAASKRVHSIDVIVTKPLKKFMKEKRAQISWALENFLKKTCDSGCNCRSLSRKLTGDDNDSQMHLPIAK